MISKGVRFMIIATLFLAGQHLLVKELSELPVAQLVLFRGLISISICSVVLYTSNIGFRGKNLRLLTQRGIVGTLSLFTFFYSLHHMPLASAVTISHMIPLFLGALGVFFLKEKMTQLQMLALLISFVGVVLLKGFDTRISGWELAIAVSSAMLAAIAHFTVRQLKDENPMVILFYFSLVIIPVIAPYALLNWVQPDLFQWTKLLLMGVVSHTGQYFLTRAFKEEEIPKLAGIYYLGILIAVMVGYFFYNESFTMESFMGMGLIILGVLITVLPFGKLTFIKKA